MRLSRHHRRTPLVMNMTPMIDIVFQLLIFFLTVNQVSRVSREPLELPALAGSQDQMHAELTLNITQDNRLLVTGQPWSLADVKKKVMELVQDHGNDPARVTMTLRVDRRAGSDLVNQVVTAMHELGVSRVRVGVQVPD
ncbi:MAG: hypothetical protein RIS70_2433 [Planctomycetota bacterium]|jgi:biopolymer transport protein ExbD